MEKDYFDGLCVYMGAVWAGREMSYAQRAAGWKLCANLPASAVEKAIDAIATDGREHLPPWSMVYKAARSIADAEREALPQLPEGDGLSENEHAGVRLQLRAMENAEQRRRADRITNETRVLPMKVRIDLAGKLLRGDGGAAKLPSATWDALFDDAVDAALKDHPQLLARETHV